MSATTNGNGKIEIVKKEERSPADTALQRLILNSVPKGMTKEKFLSEIDSSFVILDRMAELTTTENSNADKIAYILAAPDAVYSEEEKAKQVKELESKKKETLDIETFNAEMKKKGLQYQYNQESEGVKLPNRFYPSDRTKVKKGRMGISRVATTIDEFLSVDNAETILQLIRGEKTAILVYKPSALKSQYKYFFFNVKNQKWELLKDKAAYKVKRDAMTRVQFAYVDEHKAAAIVGYTIVK